MEKRESSPDLANLSQNYTPVFLGSAAVSAIENWEILAAHLQSAQGGTNFPELSENYSNYIDSINQALRAYAHDGNKIAHIKQFISQTFLNLKGLQKELAVQGHEELFYEKLANLEVDVGTFTRSEFELILLGKIRSQRPSQSDISVPPSVQNGLSKETTSNSGLYRKVEDPNGGGLIDVSAINSTNPQNSFASIFEEETNPERFDSRVTVVKSTEQPVATKVNAVIGMGEINQPQLKASLHARRTSRRTITEQGIGAVKPETAPIENSDDRPTPIEEVPITVPSSLQESLEHAIRNSHQLFRGGRTITKTFPAASVDEKKAATSSESSFFPTITDLPIVTAESHQMSPIGNTEVTVHGVPTATLLRQAGKTEDLILQDEATVENSAMPEPVEAPPISRNTLIPYKNAQGVGMHSNNIELPVHLQPKEQPPVERVIVDQNRASKPDLLPPVVIPTGPDSSDSKLPFAPTLLDPIEVNANLSATLPQNIPAPQRPEPVATFHPPLVPPIALNNGQRIEAAIHPTSHLNSRRPIHNSPKIDQETKDILSRLPSYNDYLRKAPQSPYVQPPVQPAPKKGFFAGLKSSWNSATSFLKKKYQEAKESFNDTLGSMASTFKKGFKYAAAGVGALALMAGVALWKKAPTDTQTVDQSTVHTKTSAQPTENQPAPVVNQSPKNPSSKPSTSAENVTYKVNQSSPAFQAYVGRLDKLKVSGISNMIKEVAPQVRLKFADTPDLATNYQQQNQAYLTGAENVEQQRQLLFQEFLQTALDAKYTNSGINNFIKVHQKIFELYMKDGNWRPEWKETQQLYNAFIQPERMEKDPNILGYKPNPNLAENPNLQRIKKEVPGFYNFYEQAIQAMDEDPSEYNDLNSIATHTCQKIRTVIDGYRGAIDKSGASSVQRAWCADPSRETIFRESLRKTVPVQSRGTKPTHLQPSTKPKTVPTLHQTPSQSTPKHTYNQNRQKSINRLAQNQKSQAKPTLRNSEDLKKQIPMYSWREVLKGYFWG